MVHILASSWQKTKNPQSFTITQSTFIKENNNKETETEALFYIFCHLQQTTLFNPLWEITVSTHT